MIRQLLFTAFLTPVFGFAATLLDPAAGPVALHVNNADKRQQSVAAAQSPDGKPMLEAKWNCAAASYLEFSFDKPVVLPEFRAGDLDVDLFIPENAPVRKISLRITDAEGETLQYQLTGTIKSGNQTLRYQLKDTNSNSWGAKKNGKIDFPAKLSGMSIDFDRKDGNGELWIGKIEFTPAPLEAGDLIADAAESPVNVGGGQSAAVEEIDEKKALRLNWDAAKARWFEFSFKNPLPPIEQFESARFGVELFVPEKFTASRINLRLTDKNGETFQFTIPAAELKPGWQLVPLRVNGSGSPNAGFWGGDKNKQLDFPVRITGLAVDYPANSGVGTLGIGKIFVAR